MIELSDTYDIFEVDCSAVIGVQRVMRIEARGEGHAREIARTKAKADPETYEWEFKPAGVKFKVDPDRISDVITGMCPRKIETTARDRKGKPLLIGDEINFRRSDKVRQATISKIENDAVWCEDDLFSLPAKEVWK